MEATAQGRKLTSGIYHFDDVEVGDHFETGRITVTESHVVGFAGLSGDFFDLHVDDEFARELGFPKRVAHGLLGLAMVDGLKNRAPVKLPAVASLGWNWSFKGPIFIDDSIRARVTVKAKRETKKAERGILTLLFTVLNQRDEIIQEGENLLLVLRR